MRIVARLEGAAINPAEELDALISDSAGDGAVVSFVGVTRPNSPDRGPVSRLELEHHPRLTVRSLEEIARDAATRFEVGQVRVVHRHGTLEPGEPIVFAGTSAPHRRAAFEAADYLMDRLKTEALLWKREDGPEGSVWIEPTAQDYADCGRWD